LRHASIDPVRYVRQARIGSLRPVASPASPHGIPDMASVSRAARIRRDTIVEATRTPFYRAVSHTVHCIAGDDVAASTPRLDARLTRPGRRPDVVTKPEPLVRTVDAAMQQITQYRNNGTQAADAPAGR
jgi:hypothetical protein